MKTALVDVPVAIVFFNRPECLSKVFAQVKEARPYKLFLIQDGARSTRSNDKDLIMKCRDIVDDIDWDCEVYKNYSDENLGCGRRVSSGITWVFNYVDRLIILEDDTVPSISWFSFCEKILDKYLYDERIGMITGVNHLGKYEIPTGDSYFFAKCGSIAGWATWKRVWAGYDYDCEFADHEYHLKLIEKIYYPRYKSKSIVERAKTLRSQALSANPIKRNSWSGPFGFMEILQSRLIVVPTTNMITNVGLTEEATNGGTCKAILPKKLQSIFDAPFYEINVNIIQHPQYVIENRFYHDELEKIMGGGSNPIRRLLRRFESYVRIILVRYLRLLK